MRDQCSVKDCQLVLPSHSKATFSSTPYSKRLTLTCQDVRAKPLWEGFKLAKNEPDSHGSYTDTSLYLFTRSISYCFYSHKSFSRVGLIPKRPVCFLPQRQHGGT